MYRDSGQPPAEKEPHRSLKLLRRSGTQRFPSHEKPAVDSASTSVHEHGLPKCLGGASAAHGKRLYTALPGWKICACRPRAFVRGTYSLASIGQMIPLAERHAGPHAFPKVEKKSAGGWGGGGVLGTRHGRRAFVNRHLLEAGFRLYSLCAQNGHDVRVDVLVGMRNRQPRRRSRDEEIADRSVLRYVLNPQQGLNGAYTDAAQSRWPVQASSQGLFAIHTAG